MVYHFQYILLNFCFNSFCILGHKQTPVTPCWHPVTWRLSGEVCHEQSTVWQTNEPKTETSLTGQCVCVCVRACLQSSAETSLVLFSLVEPVTTDRDGLLVVRVRVSLSGNSSGICCVSVTFNCVSVVHLGCDIHVCIRKWAAGMLAVGLTLLWTINYFTTKVNMFQIFKIAT